MADNTHNFDIILYFLSTRSRVIVIRLTVIVAKTVPVVPPSLTRGMETVVKVCEAGPSSTIRVDWAKFMNPLTSPVAWLWPVLQRSTTATRHKRKQQAPAKRIPLLN